MSVFGGVVIGKRETLCRRGAVGRNEVLLDWPDQGSPSRNWALNSRLLDAVIGARVSIRDADVAWGAVRRDDGFLARERAQMRAAGLRADADGYWRKDPQASAGALARALTARARAAAAAGRSTFAVPEAAPVAIWIAAHVSDRVLRSAAIAWLVNGASYHDLVRLAARAALALDTTPFEPVYRPKVAGELEALLSLWPHVLALPTTALLSRADLVSLRMFPVHPLGLVAEPTWADGALRVPSEYFFHDLDHVRFKVREDLLRRGFAVPDAYDDGSTIDPRTGAHRSILPFVARLVGRWPREGAAPPPVEGRHLLAWVRSLPDGATARAAKLLLFEMVHEKSLPLDGRSVARALQTEAPIVKLRRKHATGFLGAEAPPLDVVNALPAARDALLEICA